jgi:putative tryptophan/tyrosine transport system substrate-binding protein
MSKRMQRRAFIAGLGGAALAPISARAQQPGRMRRIAFLMNTMGSDDETQRRFAAFRRGLNALGWIEGRNIQIETRFAAGNIERVQTYARELVRMAPDILVTNGTPSTAAFKRETSAIPIVFAVITDPVGDGFVASLARPGGNITGFSAFDSEMGGKWVELLKEVAPGVKRAALLFNPRTAPGGGTGLMRPFFDAAARALAVELIPMAVENTAAIERSLAAHAAQPNAGLIAMPDGFVLVNSALVVRLANQLRLPAVYPFRLFAADGGLMSYGVDSADLNQRAASYVDRILKGANPADLPIQTPTKFELVINLKTAKALGIEVPLILQQRADEVIE